jgi:hypothetical protein
MNGIHDIECVNFGLGGIVWCSRGGFDRICIVESVLRGYEGCVINGTLVSWRLLVRISLGW